MNWIGILFVSPFWGVLSSLLFAQSCVSLVGLFISLVGLVAGRVPRVDILLGASAGLVQVVLFPGLLVGGYYLITQLLHFGHSPGENLVYWVFAVASFLLFVLQAPSRFKRIWANVMVPGAMDAHILEEQLKRR